MNQFKEIQSLESLLNFQKDMHVIFATIRCLITSQNGKLQ